MTKIEAASELKDLLLADDYVYFQIKIGGDLEYWMDFEVYEVTSWECDDNHTPCDVQLYITGTIRYDGFSYLWFGEKGEDDKHDGYLNLYGKGAWKLHCDLMEAVYELAEKTIEKYDADAAA